MHKHFVDWWTAIFNNYELWVDDRRAPLFGIDSFMTNLRITPPLACPSYGELSLNHGKQSTLLDTPAFENLTEDTLITLRYFLSSALETDLTHLWSEKLLLFCELHLHELRRRALKQWKHPCIAKMQILHLSGFLLEYYIVTNDLRYLNTTLKLADLPWLEHRKAFAPSFKFNNDELICALFQFKTNFQLEYSLDRMN